MRLPEFNATKKTVEHVCEFSQSAFAADVTLCQQKVTPLR
jgi:hypothetical protein